MVFLLIYLIHVGVRVEDKMVGGKSSAPRHVEIVDRVIVLITPYWRDTRLCLQTKK